MHSNIAVSQNTSYVLCIVHVFLSPTPTIVGYHPTIDNMLFPGKLSQSKANYC